MTTSLIVDLAQQKDDAEEKLDYLSKGWEACEHEFRQEINHVKEKCADKLADIFGKKGCPKWLFKTTEKKVVGKKS